MTSGATRRRAYQSAAGRSRTAVRMPPPDRRVRDRSRAPDPRAARRPASGARTAGSVVIVDREAGSALLGGQLELFVDVEPLRVGGRVLRSLERLDLLLGREDRSVVQDCRIHERTGLVVRRRVQVVVRLLSLDIRLV